MGSVQNKVHYCCVSKGNKILYSFNGDDRELEKLASICIEKTPPFHQWYLEIFGDRTFGFLIEEGFVYFAIVAIDLGNSGTLSFLERVRDDFKKVTKNNHKNSFSSFSSVRIQEEVVSVIERIICSLENFSQSDASQIEEKPANPTESINSSLIDAASSTKDPLLRGKGIKSEKKKVKDKASDTKHMISENRDIVLDVSSGINQGRVSGFALQKSSSSTRTREHRMLAQKRWCRHVRIVLAIDLMLCLVLFGIWLAICGGFRCLRK